MPCRPAQRGFTLVEMLTVVTVLVLLLSLAVPGMGKLMAKQKVSAAATNLHLSLVRARSEAMKLNTAVTLSPLSGSAWSSGWKVASASATLDTTAATSGVTVTPTPAVGSVTFNYDGRVAGAASIRFDVAEPGGAALRCVSIDPTGRAAIKDTSPC